MYYYATKFINTILYSYWLCGLLFYSLNSCKLFNILLLTHFNELYIYLMYTTCILHYCRLLLTGITINTVINNT